MALPAFDTHAYVKRLKEAGFNEQQAEAQAELQAQVLSSLVTEKLATKEDIVALKGDIARVDMRLENLIKEEVSDLKNQTKQEFIRIAGKFAQLNWMISFLLAGVMAIFFKLFLHS